MRRNLATLFLATCLAVVPAGCSIKTKNAGSWEFYVGIRTEQTSQEPAEVEIKSSLVDDLVGSVTEGGWKSIAQGIILAAQAYFVF